MAAYFHYNFGFIFTIIENQLAVRDHFFTL